MALSNPTSVLDDIRSMSDEELTEALVVSLLATRDSDPYGRAHAADRLHRLRDEAQRRRLTLVEVP